MMAARLVGTTWETLSIGDVFKLNKNDIMNFKKITENHFIFYKGYDYSDAMLYEYQHKHYNKKLYKKEY